MGTPVYSKNTMTSDMMHNHNCHAYLLKLKPFFNQKNLTLNLSYQANLAKITSQYNEKFPYGNLYSQIISSLEDQVDSLYSQIDIEQSEHLDNLIFAIYHNNNQILENTEWINEIGAQTRPRYVNTSQQIASELEDKQERINKLSPTETESILNRLYSLFSSNFKPQLGTNIPSLKNYSHRVNTAPTEYRFSTQAQRHKGEVRISPLFKRFLTINAQRSPSSQPIAYVYINNLGLDRSEFDIAGVKEREFTLALHKLEDDPSLKIAVITLPASKSLMDSNHFEKTTDELSYQDIFMELLQVAEGKKHPSGVSDFWISPKIRKLLFGNADQQTDILTKMLTKSFYIMGARPDKPLSTAKKQAVWIHFIKYELSDYILKTLKPMGYNFSCKDAIDRGALSSLLYALWQSFETNIPMQLDEFERAIDAAAANVKGRGMNFHRQLLWNGIDNFIDANYDKLIIDNKRSWLVFWRDMNCPASRVNQLLEIRISQCRKQLDLLPIEQCALQTAGKKLLFAIDEQYKAQVSGQRLLLELVSRTSQLLTVKSCSKTSIDAYKNLAEELKINYPLLHIIAGLAEIFLGIILYPPSIGYSSALITHGIATTKAGFFAPQRAQLSEDILDFSTYYSYASIPKEDTDFFANMGKQ